ncbi:MAG: hypothetical protein ACXAD7_08490 [Candidatus Kariarchaeaceae archaeon]|jgi:hypothetical protein
MSAKIAVLTTGIYENLILDELLKRDDLHLSIICSNFLDYELPPKVENAANQWHRHDLRQVLKQLAPNIYSISSSLKNLLKENDRLDLEDLDLAITSQISQIEQNSKDLNVAYELLLEETNVSNVSLIPLTDEIPNLLAFKNKKYAPIRYYYETNNLLSEEAPPKADKSKRKYEGKKLNIENLDLLQNIKLSELSNKAMQDSDLILILTSDIVTFGSLIRATELEKQIKRINTPIVLVWPFEADREPSEIEQEIADVMEFGATLDLFANDLANLTDYLIIKKSDKGFVETLRKAGCHVLLDDIFAEENGISDSLINTIFSVGNIAELIEERSKQALEDPEFEKQEDNSSKTVETEKEPEDVSEPESSKNGVKSDEEITSSKSIAQLTESPEEAGKKTIEEEAAEEKTEKITDENNVTGEMEKIKDKETKSPLEAEIANNDDIDPAVDLEFEVKEEEEWIDSVKRAIELIFDQSNVSVLTWLIDQSKTDNDNEVQIAQQAINTWIESRTNTSRRRGAEIVSKISVDRRDTYFQILQQHMISAVTDGKEDLRRRLIPLFSILHDVDSSLTEALIKGLTRELSLLRESFDIAVVERAKLTLLQLVIQSKKLTKVTIHELLNILDTRPNIGPEIWNILIAFDAGSVALELVTNFAFSKAEEIVRRSNLLRFTGSYYSTFSKVMQAWKEGDKAAISNATGSILPEETLRKFERLELARKVEKLKMVQLSTLAESLGKDAETVERLITELIVNDELHAKMKLIDDKMYLVAEEESSEKKSA